MFIPNLSFILEGESIHMSLIFNNFWLCLFCDFHLHQIHRNDLAKNDLSPVSHKTRGPFLGIPLISQQHLQPPLIFKALYFVDSHSSGFSLSSKPPALTPEQHEVLKDFPSWLACLSCSPFLLWLHLLSRFPVLFNVDHSYCLQAQRGSWKGHVHEPAG